VIGICRAVLTTIGLPSAEAKLLSISSPVRHQSIFCERATARGPALSPRPLNIVK
jgi:hypothetical protein